MKKIIISLILMICIVLPFIGCADKNSKETTVVNNTEAEKLKNKNSKLYALAFDAAWEIDAGLNANIKYISINTKTFKDFTKEDKKQLFDYIADKYKVDMLDLSIEELKNAGYVKNLTFQDGMVFQVDKYEYYSSNSVSFECMKWRSGTGAVGVSFEGKYKNGKWGLIKSNKSWIS